MTRPDDAVSDPRIDLLVVLLEQYRNDVRTALAGVPPNLRETRPGDDGWSAANVVEHLASTERSITGLISGFLGRSELRSGGEAFDRARFEEEIDMPFFLDRSRKVKGSQPTGTLGEREAWNALEASRGELFSALEQARGRRLEGYARPHPAIGRALNGYQWLAFLGLHEGRHAAQIQAIASAFTP